MADTYSESSQKANLKTRWARDDVSKKIIDFQSRKEKFSHSQRGFAKDSGVAYNPPKLAKPAEKN